MTLNVLLLTCEFPPHVGGIASHVDELARGLSRAVDAVAIVDPQSIASTLTGAQSDRLTLYRPRLVRAEPFYQLMLRGWLRRRLSHDRPDIIHVHGVRPLGATRGLSIPVVFTNHSSGFLGRLKSSPRRQTRTMKLLGHVSHLIGPSEELVQASRSIGFQGSATMIPNGVDPERFLPGSSALRMKLGIRDDEVVVLLARRLCAKNGVIWFAHALALLRHLSFRLIIAGDGDQREPMTAVLRENDLLDRTTFLGRVPNKDMPDVYRAADLAVLPSLAEATSIAGLEAMASGLPLIGTNVGGIPSIIDDTVTGLLVPPEDTVAMARALEQLIAHPDLRHRMGAAARAKVQREFAWPIIVRKTIEVYDDCLKVAGR